MKPDYPHCACWRLAGWLGATNTQGKRAKRISPLERLPSSHSNEISVMPNEFHMSSQILPNAIFVFVHCFDVYMADLFEVYMTDLFEVYSEHF